MLPHSAAPFILKKHFLIGGITAGNRTKMKNGYTPLKSSVAAATTVCLLIFEPDSFFLEGIDGVAASFFSVGENETYLKVFAGA